MGILLCEVCGQRFHKVSVLHCHQMGAHEMEYKQLHKNTELNIAVFSFLGNVSIYSGGNGGAINSDVSTLAQSGMMKHCIFSGTDTVGPSFFMSAQQMDDCWEATMTAYARRQQQINGVTDSQGSNIRRQMNTTMSFDVSAKDRIVRITSSNGARASRFAIPINLQRTTGGSTNSLTARGGPETNWRVCTNYAPMGQQGTNRVVWTRTQVFPRDAPDPSVLALRALMQNIKAMKVLNNQICDQIANSRKISLRQLSSSFRTPTVVPLVNCSELMKQGCRVGINVKNTQTNEVVPTRNDELYGFPEHSSPPAKRSVAVAEGCGEGEKATTQLTTLKHKNCSPTSQPPSKRIKGVQNLPNKLNCGEPVPNTSSVLETNTKVAAAATVTVSGARSGVELVGKATASTSKAIEGREKVPPQKTSPNLANGFNPTTQPSAKNDKEVQSNENSTKLVHGRVVPITSSMNVSTTKSAVASVTAGHGTEMVSKKITLTPKKRPFLPKPDNNGAGGMEIALAKLKTIVPTMPGTDYIMPTLSGIGWVTDKWGKQLWICLVCKQAEEEKSSKDMICCDECDKWYHFECVGIMENVAVDDPWYCKICIYKLCGNKKDVFPEIFKND